MHLFWKTWQQMMLVRQNKMILRQNQEITWLYTRPPEILVPAPSETYCPTAALSPPAPFAKVISLEKFCPSTTAPQAVQLLHRHTLSSPERPAGLPYSEQHGHLQLSTILFELSVSSAVLALGHLHQWLCGLGLVTFYSVALLQCAFVKPLFIVVATFESRMSNLQVLACFEPATSCFIV